jgi:hypothetical protein
MADDSGRPGATLTRVEHRANLIGVVGSGIRRGDVLSLHRSEPGLRRSRRSKVAAQPLHDAADRAVAGLLLQPEELPRLRGNPFARLRDRLETVTDPPWGLSRLTVRPFPAQ